MGLINIKMKTFIVLAFIATMVLVITADQEEGEEYDLTMEELDNINNLEVARNAREAEAGRRVGGRKQKKYVNRKKKAGKGKRKGEKKQRKVGKKERKSGKKQRKVNKAPRAGCSRSVNSTCVDTAVRLINTVNTKIINYLKQQKRIAKFNNTRSKKSGKKGLFGPIASKVIDIGGGNSSDLSCSGNKTSEGAGTLKEIIGNLSKCEEDIKAACDVSAYPIPNKTEADACVSNMESMKKGVDACTKKSGSEGCSCWLDPALLATAEKVKPCNIASENKRVTSQHKKCTNTFSACKKIEDSAVDAIYACSQSA